MVFVGVHGERGRIDVTQADLGCGQDRESIYKTKRPAPLTCYECDWRLHLVHKTHGAYDLWFLRHASKAPRCEARAAGEGMAHHLLKLDLAHHARAAGWSAEYEVAAPDGSWRADVMATSPDGSRRVALEAQMASISVTDIDARTTRYSEASVEVCWFTDRKTVPWLDHVPSVRIARPGEGGPVQVTAGAARFEPKWCEDRAVCDLCECEDCGAGVDGPLPCEGHGTWEPAAPFPLERFVAAICTNATRPHRLRVGWGTKGKWRWITRRYFELEEEQLQAHIRKYQIVERLLAVQQRQHKARQAAEQEHLAAIEALLQRQKAGQAGGGVRLPRGRHLPQRRPRGQPRVRHGSARVRTRKAACGHLPRGRPPPRAAPPPGLSGLLRCLRARAQPRRGSGRPRPAHRDPHH
ncbi:competence protein CoiA family protein [Streptomyces salinarius]|uniref:competence protein CoiA family protein n=1 Tax=Streptomyces salinarius TaxID=2762598 RepID=UPI0032E04ED3